MHPKKIQIAILTLLLMCFIALCLLVIEYFDVKNIEPLKAFSLFVFAYFFGIIKKEIEIIFPEISGKSIIKKLRKKKKKK